MALLVLRATPIDSHLPSPAELLDGRRVVSNLPVAISNASGPRCAIRTRLDERRTFLYSHEDRSSAHATRTPIDGSPPVLSTRVSNHVPLTLNRPAEESCYVIDETSAKQPNNTCCCGDDDDDPRREENPKRSDKSASDSSVDERDPQRQTTVRYVEPTRTRSGRIIRAPPRLDL